MPTAGQEIVVHDGRFVRLARRGAWEYATRPNATGVVAIVAQHDDGRLVLVEQARPPIGARVIELPAGLAGDDGSAESMLAAAQRELAEETGYVAASWTRLGDALSSPGLTDERITFFHATRLSRDAGTGGGVDGEEIVVHEVPIDEVPDRLVAWRDRGMAIDMKLLAGLYAEVVLNNREA
ncbi:NUDIX hydrolase [Phycisphaeraceae bacterium D3-23]